MIEAIFDDLAIILCINSLTEIKIKEHGSNIIDTATPFQQLLIKVIFIMLRRSCHFPFLLPVIGSLSLNRRSKLNTNEIIKYYQSP